MTSPRRASIIALITASCVWCACDSTENKPDSWSHYRGDLGNTAYASLDQINLTTIKDLEVAWMYHTGDADTGNRSTIQCNPLHANGMLYVTSPKLKLIALDPASGAEKWKFDPFKDTQATGVNRGVTYYQSDDEKRIYFSAGPYLYALNADTGNLVDKFGNHGKVDLRIGLGRDPATLAVWATSPGVIFNDVLIQGTALGEGYDAAPGFIRGYNIHTGEIVWTFHTIPQPGETGYDTWSGDAYKEAGGTNSWAGMSLDEKRGIVYLPTGSPAFDFYGGNRGGKNLFGNCLIALDAATGKLKWYYQLVHHDLWDYDLPAPPNLVTVKHNGKAIDAVAQVTKMGMVFLFDRETGEPLFPIEERAVSPSTLEGERASETQPFPVLPKPFVRHAFSKDEIINISQQSFDDVSKKVEGARGGTIFTPPAVEGVVQFPGTRGGAEWGGAAVDPESAIMFVNANEIPFLIKMRKLEAETNGAFLAQQGENIFKLNNCTMCHGADRAGSQAFPSLLNLSKRKSESEVVSLLKNGKGQMPAFPNLNDEQLKSLIAFLFDKKALSEEKTEPSKSTKQRIRYAHDGWKMLTDAKGYPGIKPPWGTLNAIDLNSGEILWQVPLGEYPELSAQGIPPTGTHNLGGPAVTSGGLVFIGATRDEMFRAFDKSSGKIVWQYKLPAGGYATPSIYQVDGKQYVVIAAGGGGKVGSPSGDTYVAFALNGEAD